MLCVISEKTVHCCSGRPCTALCEPWLESYLGLEQAELARGGGGEGEGEVAHPLDARGVAHEGVRVDGGAVHLT
jgi:hypothetical protein